MSEETKAPAANVDTQTQPLPATAQTAGGAVAPTLPVVPIPARPTVPIPPPSIAGRRATSAEESARMSREQAPVTGVSAEQIQSVSVQIRQQFIDAVADLTGTAREAMGIAADVFVPLIAEQSILQQM